MERTKTHICCLSVSNTLKLCLHLTLIKTMRKTVRVNAASGSLVTFFFKMERAFCSIHGTVKIATKLISPYFDLVRAGINP